MSLYNLTNKTFLFVQKRPSAMRVQKKRVGWADTVYWNTASNVRFFERGAVHIVLIYELLKIKY